MITFSVKWDVFFRIDSQINAFHSFKKKNQKHHTQNKQVLWASLKAHYYSAGLHPRIYLF